MPRDKQIVRERLQHAALALYRDHGYDRTTTAQIAKRAGVTERTFFRHFADKREVLFDGEDMLRAALTTGIAQAPAMLGPLNTLLQAFRSIEPLLEENRSFSEPRQRIIAATPALQERELAKIAAVADSLAVGLMDRGVDKRAAVLAAKVGMTALVEATNAWLADDSERFIAYLEAAFTELRNIVASAAQIPPEEKA